jgi:predicted ABC-class ATPase
MKDQAHFNAILKEINGKGYKAYKRLKGEYNYDDYTLIIDHVQGDPFADPSKIRVRVPQSIAGFPPRTFKNTPRAIALRDFLTRRFDHAIRRYAKGHRGSGKSGVIAIDRPGQEILERTAAFVDQQTVEVRFTVGLPARGRRIDSRQAAQIFSEELPRIIQEALIYNNLDPDALQRHVETAEDADFLRDQLRKMGLLAFVADGAHLPRKSGVDPRPLDSKNVVRFASPASLRKEVTLPNRGSIQGMGIPHGVTLIVGGGYHGKSTLLDALALGIYDHIPGDGREFVVTDPNAFKVRAEDRRRIAKVDISPFIANLPFGKDTRRFSSEDASGSTSQAANIIEALEMGAKVLLVDEDTSATNFMIRDQRMQKLISKDKEPITPFIDKVKQIFSDKGVSTVLVMGGIGDYFDVADTVIWMKDYLPHEVTDQARRISQDYPTRPSSGGPARFGAIEKRIPYVSSVDPRRGKKAVDIKVRETNQITVGRYKIDLSRVEQLTDPSQLRAMAQALVRASRHMGESATVREVVEAMMREIQDNGLDGLSPRYPNNFAQFRALDLAAALNRLPSLAIKS